MEKDIDYGMLGLGKYKPIHTDEQPQYECAGSQVPSNDNVNDEHNYAAKEHINLTLINVCGLTSKIETPEFIELLNNNDIFVAIETKLDSCAD